MIAPTTVTATTSPEDQHAHALLASVAGSSQELLPSMAHELRAPLASLAAAAELMQDSEPLEQRRLAEIIHRQAYRMSGIVDAVLQMYAASSATPTRATACVDLSAFLSDLCTEQAAAFGQHTFEVHVTAGRAVTADRRMLAIVVANLLSNAAKYSPAGSTVSVSAALDGEYTLIEVEDEGSGVPPEFRRRIFEPGFRNDTERSDSFGLGLFVADRLCAQMRGSVSIEPATRGCGARFVVRLPRHDGGSLDAE